MAGEAGTLQNLYQVSYAFYGFSREINTVKKIILGRNYLFAVIIAFVIEG